MGGRLARDEGKTGVSTTHQLAMAEELADRVAVSRAGRVNTDLATRELLHRYAEDRFDITGSGAGRSLVLPAGARLSSVDGQATVQLPTSDQNALHAVLAQLRAAGVPLLGVSRVRPTLEDVFLTLVKGE